MHNQISSQLANIPTIDSLQNTKLGLVAVDMDAHLSLIFSTVQQLTQMLRTLCLMPVPSDLLHVSCLIGCSFYLFEDSPAAPFLQLLHAASFLLQKVSCFLLSCTGGSGM